MKNNLCVYRNMFDEIVYLFFSSDFLHVASSFRDNDWVFFTYKKEAVTYLSHLNYQSYLEDFNFYKKTGKGFEIPLVSLLTHQNGPLRLWAKKLSQKLRQD